MLNFYCVSQLQWKHVLAMQRASRMPQGGTDLIFYGDSLTELWRGTAWGYTSRLGYGIPDVFSQYFGRYSTAICGSGGEQPCMASCNTGCTVTSATHLLPPGTRTVVLRAGDTSGNVWWRIQNGELPRNHAPKVVVLMVGANDLSGAYVNCGTWDEADYTNAATSVAQQCGPSPLIITFCHLHMAQKSSLTPAADQCSLHVTLMELLDMQDQWYH